MKNYLADLVKTLRPTSMALIVLGGMFSLGWAGASQVGALKNLPEQVTLNQEDISTLKTAVAEIQELLQESNCLAIAEIDPSKNWRECLTTQGDR